MSGALELSLWQLISLLLAFFGCVAGFFKLLLARFDEQLAARFASQDAQLAQMREEARQWQRVERDLLALRAELPERYVRREDYIRGQSVLEAKLDALALKLENVQIKVLKQ